MGKVRQRVLFSPDTASRTSNPRRGTAVTNKCEPADTKACQEEGSSQGADCRGTAKEIHQTGCQEGRYGAQPPPKTFLAPAKDKQLLLPPQCRCQADRCIQSTRLEGSSGSA